MAELGELPEAAPRKKVGRPPIEFDLSVVEGLGRIGATAFEMAQILPGSRSTIEHRMADTESDFCKAYQKGRAFLSASLRRKQIQVAMSGNVTMLIWLGKQHLWQQERSVVADLDLNACTPEQLRRLADGEDPMVVMGWFRRR
jgi:hypothetical protein